MVPLGRRRRSVYGTILGAQILLFSVVRRCSPRCRSPPRSSLVIRQRPGFRPDPHRQKWRHRYLRFEKRYRVWLIVVIALYLGVRTGTRAATAGRPT